MDDQPTKSRKRTVAVWTVVAVGLLVSALCLWLATWHGWLSMGSPPAATPASAERHARWFMVCFVMIFVSPVVGVLIARRLRRDHEV